MMLRVELRPLAASIVVVVRQLDPSQVCKVHTNISFSPSRLSFSSLGTSGYLSPHRAVPGHVTNVKEGST